MKSANKAAPTIAVIFGGTGDLTKRKLIPAFYHLYLDGWLPAQFAVIGLGRSPFNDANYRDRLEEGLKEFSRSGDPSDEKWDQFSSSLYYLQSDVNNPESYRQLAEKIKAIEDAWGTRANHLFYLSVAPKFIEAISVNLSQAGIASDPERDRIVVEKPSGHDLKSAK